jgi:hypothetical protein
MFLLRVTDASVIGCVENTLATTTALIFFQTGYVLHDHRIPDDLGIPLHFLCHLIDKCNLLLKRVETHSLADIAASDIGGILFAIFRPAK